MILYKYLKKFDYISAAVAVAELDPTSGTVL
jgi:hypothetical protein